MGPAEPVWTASNAQVEGVVVVRLPTEMLPFTVTLVEKVAALLTPRVPFSVRFEKVGLLVVPKPMVVAAAAAEAAVKTESPIDVDPRLVRVAARIPLSNCRGLVKVKVLVPP